MTFFYPVKQQQGVLHWIESGAVLRRVSLEEQKFSLFCQIVSINIYKWTIFASIQGVYCLCKGPGFTQTSC